MLKTITGPVGLNDMNPVRQPIQHRTHQSLRAAHFRPTLERQVRSNNQTLTLIGSTDHLEQQLGAGLTKWNIAKFIKDQQVLFFKRDSNMTLSTPSASGHR